MYLTSLKITSYGGILRFTRMFTGSGTDLGADNDVIIVGGNGARLYFSSFRSQPSGAWEKVGVNIICPQLTCHNTN